MQVNYGTFFKMRFQWAKSIISNLNERQMCFLVDCLFFQLLFVVVFITTK